MFREDGVLLKDGRSCLPQNEALRDSILKETYSSTYAMHLESTKMYKTLKVYYWRLGMKREIIEFVAKCLIY